MIRLCFVLFVGICICFSPLVGCGADEEVIAPGEEVEVTTWVAPTDIGGEYPVDDVEVGDTVLLSTGEQYTIGQFDGAVRGEWGLFITSYTVKPDPEEPGTFIVLDQLPRGYVVPEGPPIVYFEGFFWSDTTEVHHPTRRITKESSIVTDGEDIGSLDIEIDRVLDYNLPIYVEIQSQDREELGGAVRRSRSLFVIPKGSTSARGPNFLHILTESDYVRGSISILPYTEMEEIELPAEIEVEPHVLSLKNRVLLKGHVFRPYRISSSSFLMRDEPIERNW